jgi:histidinol phosphatase-like enzyme
MLGDMVTDMQFGRNSGMKTVYIDTNKVSVNSTLYDETFSSLIEFANKLKAIDLI